MAPVVASSLFWAGTPFAGAQTSPAASAAAVQPGTVSGTIVLPPGTTAKSVEGLRVQLAEAGLLVTTDAQGHYEFTGVAPGSYTLIVSGSGFSRLKVLDVVVKGGEGVILYSEPMPSITKDGQVDESEEVVVSARKDVEVMDKYNVNGTRAVPFTGTDNIDIPRTVDDVQPYYMFSSTQIEQSGATDLQDFFQRRVPMDTNHSPESTMYNTSGNHSNVNIGGIGTNSGGVSGGTINTLILVDGRPLPGFMYVNTTSQGDINGIPMAAVDHIEVLTATASAIYGSSASGGVINIVLKRDYSGGELRYSYANTFDTDAPIRDVSLTWGEALEGGKTHVMVSANYQTQKPVFAQDRLNVIDPYLAKYFSLYPNGELAALGILSSTTGLYTATSGAMLAQPIITSTTLTPLFAGSTATTVQVPVGYVNSATNGLAPLQANIGNYNLAHPNNAYYRTPIGDKFPEDQGPTEKGINVQIKRQMLPWLEVYAQVSSTTDFSLEPGDPFTLTVNVPVNSPYNPFGQIVRVTSSMQSDLGPERVDIVGRSFATGATLTLPFNWKGDIDYTWSTSTYSLFSLQPNSAAITAAVLNGTLNPITDLAAHPFDALPYDETLDVTQASTVNNIQGKFAGPLMKLWAGAPTLAIGLEHEKSGSVGGQEDILEASNQIPNVASPATAVVNEAIFYTGQSVDDDSAYVELTAPLVSHFNKIFLVRSLELQAAGRVDKESYNTTSPASEVVGVSATGATITSPNLLSGLPEPLQNNPTTRYSSKNGTIGLKYNPIDDITLRASFSTGFIPPTYTQLLAPISTGTQTQPIAGIYPGVPTTSPWAYANITDPLLNNAVYAVPVKSGGNSNLTPETSRGINWGVIYEPHYLKGLRLSLDFDKTTKHNAIITPTAATLLANPNAFPDRITRGPAATGQSVGPVILIDTTNINAPEVVTSTYNFTASYEYQTQSMGTFTLSAIASSSQHYKLQSVIGGPLIEQLSNPNASGSTTGIGTGIALARFKGNVSLDWTKGGWGAGWLARYTGPYTEGSTDGLGQSSQYVTGSINGFIAGQIYHDVYVSYKTSAAGPASTMLQKAIANVKVQLEVSNVFNKIPPYDAADSYNADYSTYGDIRLATYNLSVSKSW